MKKTKTENTNKKNLCLFPAKTQEEKQYFMKKYFEEKARQQGNGK